MDASGFPAQLPENLPFPKTADGVVVMFLVFLLATALTYKITNSRWSWVPGIICGLVAGAVIG